MAKASIFKISPLQLFLVLLMGTKISSFKHSISYSQSSVSYKFVQYVLVGLVLPWTISGSAVSNVKAEDVETGRAASSSLMRSSAAGLPHQKSTANNALLANIDFLTQLTNSKQEKNSEMDPLKCFPKALCGLSSESAAITRRRKNGLITDYIRLMKAVSLNPSVMDSVLEKMKDKAAASDQQQDDVYDESESNEDEEAEDEEAAAERETDNSEEKTDGEYDENDDDEEEEDRGRRTRIKKYKTRKTRNSLKVEARMGKSSASTIRITTKSTTVPPSTTKKPKKLYKEFDADDSDEFTKQYLQEKAHVENLMNDGYFNEDTDTTNWWAYENEKEPELENLVDDSAGQGRLDSQSHEVRYTFGGKRKPKPPTPPEQPVAPMIPQAPPVPLATAPKPPLIKPPSSPIQQTTIDTSSVFSNFFKSLFAGITGGGSAFSKDPFFEGFQRSMPDGTPTVVTVDKTKEILTTAIEIGESLKTPAQCNSLFNGCKYQYVELLHLIDDIRNTLQERERGKDGFQSSSSYDGIEEYSNFNGGSKKGKKGSSYGYQSSLSEISQAETLVPDYEAAASDIRKSKAKKRKHKKSSSYRHGKMSSMSKENSVEIGSDEPTIFGSGHPNFGMHRQKHGLPHQPSAYYNTLNQNYQQSQHHSSYDDMYIRQPKSLWGTILSWFGFRR